MKKSSKTFLFQVVITEMRERWDRKWLSTNNSIVIYDDLFSSWSFAANLRDSKVPYHLQSNLWPLDYRRHSQHGLQNHLPASQQPFPICLRLSPEGYISTKNVLITIHLAIYLGIWSMREVTQTRVCFPLSISARTVWSLRLFCFSFHDDFVGLNMVR